MWGDVKQKLTIYKTRLKFLFCILVNNKKNNKSSIAKDLSGNAFDTFSLSDGRSKMSVEYQLNVRFVIHYDVICNMRKLFS